MSVNERTQSRPWTEAEDDALRRAVALYGENDNWKRIAEVVQHRTNKACRKRWLHSLKPTVKKCAWSQEEDQTLLRLYEELGPKWSAIARSIEGRTDDACSKRYREALNPALKKDDWTLAEDDRLMEIIQRLGHQWALVAHELQRSSLACRNRWRLLQRRISKAQQDSTPDFSHLQPMLSPFMSTVPEPTESPLHFPRQMDALQYTPEPFTYYSPYEHHHNLEPLNVRDLPTLNFDSSSSSLSSALDESLAVSRRPRLQQTLPTIVEHMHDRVDQQGIWTSPLSLENTPELVQDQFDEHEYQFSPDLIVTADVQDSGLLPHEDRYRYRDHDIFSASPMMTSLLQLSPTNPTQSAKSFYMELDFDHSPASSVASWDFYPSSASSTPFGLGLQTTLSPTESPNPVSPLDLPNQLQESGSSLLFSPAGVPRVAPSKRTRKLPQRKNRPTIKVTSSARLSSMLPLSNDPTIRPYACGYDECQSPEFSYSTSRDLSDHWKDKHGGECQGDAKPFKCSLEGCGKTWKNINGLQYHLQVAAGHFKEALFNRVSLEQTTSISQTPISGPEAELDDDGSGETRYACGRKGCIKVYRQASGLRYHLKHGHKDQEPTQVAVVPPALERQIPAKVKKMRLNPLSDQVQTTMTTPLMQMTVL